MTYKVKTKNVYGTDKIYPVCDKAKALASIAGTTTITDRTVMYAAHLGLTMEEVTA